MMLLSINMPTALLFSFIIMEAFAAMEPSQDCSGCSPVKGCLGQPGPPGIPGKDGRDGRDSIVTSSLVIDLIKRVADLEQKLAMAGKPNGFAILDKDGNIPETSVPSTFDGIPGKVTNIENEISQRGKPNGLAVLDSNGNVPASALPSGYNKVSAYDLAWQSLHVSAAAACRGSTATGGSGPYGNTVLMRNNASGKTCTQICSNNPTFKNCDAEVSIMGFSGKGTVNGEILGYFYNYGCDATGNGGSEANTSEESILSKRGYLGFCCCRK